VRQRERVRTVAIPLPLPSTEAFAGAACRAPERQGGRHGARRQGRSARSPRERSPCTHSSSEAARRSRRAWRCAESSTS
jgi:hypothetical protein